MPADSMNIGVSGMDAYQAQIDVISNNIANVGTTAYKGQSLTFQDLLYQTQQPASGPTKTNGGVNANQIGIGVKVGATDTNTNQGGIQTTGVNTNMMINGDGYFILNDATGAGAPKYTRNGDFSLNSTGMLYDPSSGLGVMGYSATGGVIANTGTPGPIQVPIGLKSQATATGAGLKHGPSGDKVFDMSYSGNLDSTQYAAAVSNGAVSPSMQSIAGTTIYDSLGGAHLVNVAFAPAITNGGAGNATMPFQVSNASGAAVTAATEWAYTVTSTDGTLFQNGATTSLTSPVQYAFFDQNGQFINTSATAAPVAGAVLTGAANVHLAGAPPVSTDGNQLTVAKWAPTGNNPTTNTVTPGPLGIDLSLMTSQASSSAAGIQSSQNGKSPGILSNVSVAQDGTLTGAFTNGDSQTIGRVAIAAFQNEQGLTRVGASQYETSANSGEAQIGTANAGRFGSIVGDSLELSNVSIADEFTKLITAQNAFTANSKSITTANQDDQTVIGLIR